MSLLRDFGGALLTNVGADMQQRENDQRLTALQESIEKRRYAREMNRKARDEKQLPQPYGTPVQRGPGNWVQPTQEFQPSTYDEETGEPITESSWKPGADTPAQDPNALKPYEAARVDLARDKLAQDQEYQQGRLGVLKAKGAGGSGGSTGAAPKSRWLPLSGNMEQLQEWDGAKFIPVGDPRPRWESASSSGGSSSDKTGAAARKELHDAVKLLSKAKTTDEIVGAARIAGIPIPSKAELTPPTPGRLYGTNEASDEDYKAALKAHVGSQLDERLAPKKAEAQAPAVPAGANEGATYEDDKTGQRWKVQNGKMVPA